MSLRFRPVERNVVELTTPNGTYRVTANELAKALRAAEECIPTSAATLRPGAYALARSETTEVLAFAAGLLRRNCIMPLPELLRHLTDAPVICGYLYYIGPTTSNIGQDLLFVMHESTPTETTFVTCAGGGGLVAGDMIFYALNPDSDGIAIIEGNATEVPPLS